MHLSIFGSVMLSWDAANRVFAFSALPLRGGVNKAHWREIAGLRVKALGPTVCFLLASPLFPVHLRFTFTILLTFAASHFL